MDKNVRTKHETIGFAEQRNLIEMSKVLGKEMTKEEYDFIMFIYEKVLYRLMYEAKKEGINI